MISHCGPFRGQVVSSSVVALLCLTRLFKWDGSQLSLAHEPSIVAVCFSSSYSPPPAGTMSPAPLPPRFIPHPLNLSSQPIGTFLFGSFSVTDRVEPSAVPDILHLLLPPAGQEMSGIERRRQS